MTRLLSLSLSIVEGSLSSSRLRKKVEASKLKSAEGMGISSDQQRNALKAGEPLNY
jgi:hypothetical protein